MDIALQAEQQPALHAVVEVIVATIHIHIHPIPRLTHLPGEAEAGGVAGTVEV